jgi:hypothetical protein
MKLIKTYNNYILEKFNINDIKVDIENKDEEIVKLIKSKFNIIIKKLKHKNIRLISISGFLHDKAYKDIKYKLVLKFNNNDEIIGSLFKDNVCVKINDEVVYDIDNKDFNIELLIDKIYDNYIKYIKNKNYKIVK